MAIVVVNVLVKLAPSRRRFARSMKRLIQICANSDAKLYAAARPRAFLPIFPTDDVALQDALTLISDRCTAVLNPTR